MNAKRANSIVEYGRKCPATGMQQPHDWRYATSAPGSYVGDNCAMCQRCGLQGIKIEREGA